MSTNDAIRMTVFEVMSAYSGQLQKNNLRVLVENKLGRALTNVEAGIEIWKAREAYLRKTKTEVIGAKGTLSVATPEQSLNRRAKEMQRALRTMERSAERASTLAERNDLTEHERKAFIRASERTNTVLVHATDALRRSKKKLPPGV